MGRSRVLAGLVVAVLVLAGVLVRPGIPVDVTDSAMSRVPCVSYAPFRDGESPFDPSFHVTRERLAEDLAHLKTLTSCVRTYASSNGLDQLAAEAEKLGMHVLLGIWIGGSPVDNRSEVERAVTIANAYPQTVKAVIVGNEVLLRREQAPEGMAAFLREVRSRVPQPVTYADVWEFWTRHAEALKNEVDFVTVHILPYWEDEPADIDTALRHVRDVRESVGALFAGQDVLIGETGWPTRGRQREGAEPGLVNATRFIRGVLDMADSNGWRVNLIEAFDQMWKRDQEGTVGGYWGLQQTGGKPKILLKGPVVEDPDWLQWVLVALGTGVFIFVAVIIVSKRIDRVGFAISVVGALAAGEVIALLARHSVLSSRSLLEWGVNGGVGLLAVVSAVAFLSVLQSKEPGLGVWHGLLYRMTLAVAATSAFGLAFGGRYRDFPASMVLIVAVALVLLWIRDSRILFALPGKPEDVWLAGTSVPAVLFACSVETWRNDDALVWGATVIALVSPAIFRAVYSHKPSFYRPSGAAGPVDRTG